MKGAMDMSKTKISKKKSVLTRENVLADALMLKHFCDCIETAYPAVDDKIDEVDDFVEEVIKGLLTLGGGLTPTEVHGHMTIDQNGVNNLSDLYRERDLMVNCLNTLQTKTTDSYEKSLFNHLILVSKFPIKKDG